MAGHSVERPPYGIAPAGDTLGLRHVREALRDLPFPATTKEILDRAGRWRIPITGTHFHRLDEMMEGVGDHRFRDADEVARRIARAHHELRE